MSFPKGPQQAVPVLWTASAELVGRRGRASEKGGDLTKTGRDNSVVDTEGARALAKRIALGPPRGEGDEPVPRKTGRGTAPVEVYLKPRPGRRREVRTYVRGADGHLERSDR